MGLYDDLSLPGTPADGAQVKLWNCEMRTYKVGDKVPMPMPKTYGVVLQEGGVLLVDDGVIAGWQEDFPEGRPLYDKWGGEWISEEENTGMFGTNYFGRK